MSQEPTPTAASTEGQEPEGANGQEPTPASTSTATTPDASSTERQTFDADYVKQLRKQAASTRTELNTVKAELDAIKDRDKTETERLTERVAASEQRASAAEMRLARYEVMATHKIDLEYAELLAGSTPEELDANAKKLAQLIANRAQSSGFDGGARQTPPETRTPEESHNDFLLRAMGRKSA